MEDAMATDDEKDNSRSGFEDMERWLSDKDSRNTPPKIELIPEPTILETNVDSLQLLGNNPSAYCCHTTPESE